MRYKESGFTLLELLATVAIVAILFALAVPTFIGMLERASLKEAVENIASDIHFMRSESLKRKADLVLSFNTVTWCYGVEEKASPAVSPNCNCSASPSTCTIKSVPGSRFNRVDSTATTATNGDHQVSWVRGTMTTDSITLDTESGYDLRIETNPVGRVWVCSPSDNVAGYPSC